MQDFFEPRPGLWAAKTLKWTGWTTADDAAGKPIEFGRTTTTVTRLEIGDDAKLQPEEFQLPLPADVKVIEDLRSNPASGSEVAPAEDSNEASPQT